MLGTRTLSLKLLMATAAMFAFASAQAASFGSGITYTGRIVKDENPIESGTIRFFVWIQTQGGCDLYAEQRDVDMTGSGGTYSFEIGNGAAVSSFPHTSFGIKTIADVFDNTKKTSDLDTSRTGCLTFTPNSDEGRVMKVQFIPPGEAVAQALPDLVLTAVPTAQIAFNATKVNGYGTGDLLKVDPAYTAKTTANNPLTAAQYEEFWKLILGTSTTYLKSIPTLGGDATGTLPAVTVTKIQNVAVTAPTTGDTGKVLTYNGTGMVWSAAAAGSGITTLNGLSATTQSFVSGTTPLTISSSGSAHTFNITNASSSASGLLTQADWNTFNNKQSSSLASGQVWVGNASGAATAVTLSGDVSVSNAGVTALKAVGTAGTYSKVVTDAQGRVVSGSGLSSGDVTSALGYTPTAGASGYVNGGNTFAGNATIGLNDNYNLGFKTNNTTKMTLTSDGKLGIGTAAPNTALTIASGDITLDAGYSMMWGQSAYSFINGDSGPSSHLILGTSGAIVMILDVNGNVGIGTNPAFTLDMGSRTDAARLPMGNTSQRPANTKGIIRYNTSTDTVEFNNGSGWANLDSSLGYTPVNRAGDTMSGALNMGANDLSNTGSISMAANKYFGLSANSTDGTVAGQVWYDSGVIKYFDGTSARTLGVSGAGITSLNGLTSGTQSFVMGTSGNSPAFSSAGSAHTLNIPMASASSVTAGLISNADYASMMAKQSGSLAAGQMWVGNASGAAQAFSLSGDVASISNTGSVTVNKSTTGQSNYILALDGSGVANAYGFGVKGATSGTVTLQAATTTANYSLKLPSTTPVANQVMQSDASGNLSWANAVTTATGFVNGGNSFGTTANLGTNDNNDLNIKTNNTTRFSILKTGEVGISPSAGGASFQIQNGGMEISRDDSWPEFTVSGYGNSGGNYWTPQINLTYARGTKSLPTYAQSGDTLGAIRASNHTNGLGAFIRFDATQTHTASVSGTKLSFVTVPNGNNIGNVAMSLAQDGKVAIGSSAPSYALDMQDWTDAIRLPAGNTSQRPANASGLIRYNTTNSNVEFNNGSGWSALATSSGSTGFVNGGNSFAGNATIGLNDTYNLGFKTDNLTRMTITAAGNVGIGTTSPAGALDVIGSSGSDVYLNLQNTNASGFSTLALNNNTGTVAEMFVNGSSNTSGAGANSLTIGTFVSSPMAFYTNGTEKMRITSAGNIGVGNASPAVALDIGSMTDAIRLPNGTDAQRPTNAKGNIRYNTTSNVVEYNNGSGWVTVGTMSGSMSSSLTAGQMWVGNASNVAQAFSLSGDISSVSSTGSVTVNKTTTGTNNTILSLDGSGVANAYGVGVKGATSGTVTLQAATTTATYSLKLPATTPAANQVMQSDSSGNLSWATALTSSTGYLNGGNAFAGNATIGLNDAYTLGFKTSNTTQMTLTAAGRLGIGTATPSGALEVQGGTAAASVTGAPITLKAQHGGSGGAVGGSIYLTPGDGTSGWPGGTVVIATTSGQNGAITANNDTTNSYASSAGSSSPSYVMRLANNYNQNNNTALINGDVKNSSNLFQEGYMGFLSVAGAANYSPDFVLGMQSGNNSYQERLRIIGSSGNVGIGTSSPAYSLDFNGKTDAIRLPAGNTSQQPANAAGLIRYNTTNSSVEYNNGSGWTGMLSSSSNAIVKDGNSFGAHLIIGTNDNYDFRFETGGATAMTIEPSGEVGIGTTTPGYKLDIASTDGSVLRGNTYSNTASQGSNVMLYRGRGTASSTTAVQANDTLGGVYARGYGATSFGSSSTSYMEFSAAQTFTDTKRGSYMTFFTTPNDSATPVERMRIAQNGNVGIGVNNPGFTLEVASSIVDPNYATMQVTNTNATSTWTPVIAGMAPNAQNGAAVQVVYGVGPTNGNRVEEAFVYHGDADATNAYSLGFYGKNDLFTILYGGNIGLGTASPEAGVQIGEEAPSASPRQLYFGEAKSSGTQRPQIVGQWNSGGAWGMGPSTTAANDYRVRIGYVTGTNSDWDSSQKISLDVDGPVVSAPQAVTGATVNLAASNTITISSIGSSTITLQNMVHGGNYTLLVSDTTSRTYTFSGCNTSKFKPANTATVSGTSTMYNIITVYNGSSYDCWITWASGYQ